jgi:hypothetical protein
MEEAAKYYTVSLVLTHHAFLNYKQSPTLIVCAFVGDCL